MKSKTKNFHLQYQISRPNLFDPSMLCCPNHNSKTNTSIKQDNHPSKPGNKPEDFLTSYQQPHMIKDHNWEKAFLFTSLLNSWNIWKHHLAIANIQKQPCTFNNQEQWWDIADQEKNKKMLSKFHNQTPISLLKWHPTCLKVTYQTKTPEHVNPRISDVTKTALHIQQQRIMTGNYRLIRRRRKYSLKTS